MAVSAEPRQEQPPTDATPAGAGGAVGVSAVRTQAERTAFIRFPYSIYRGDPNWVPPLEMERRDFLDPRKHPFFDFGEVELFLARRPGGELVGRIAAVKDPRFNEFQGTRWGFFGLFECVDDPAVARALFEAAAGWLRARGFETMVGPVSYSTNYECALLVDGFDAPPAVMMPYNPRYYPGLLEAVGFTKAKDLWAYELSSSHPVPEKVVRIAEKLREREGVTVRPLRMKELDAEVARIKAIYNSALEKNWGFVPMTEREFDHLAREFKQIVEPELVLVAEVKGEAVGFAMTLPDANQALKAAGGRLTRFGLPIGLVKLALAARRIDWLRMLVLGLKPGYRRRGIDAILYLDTIRNAQRLGYRGGEISWELEDNHLINRAIESMGGQRSKTYRLYQRPL
jgi:GNAT superfamily N-acetyltransferase